jgi:DNA-binding transcriptional regulator YbjK
MRPRNKQRYIELTDAAIDIVTWHGLHGLSHRAVDEAANVPRGTTSNYFRSRDALVEATTRRLMNLHFALMSQRRPHAGTLDRQELIEYISGVLDQALSQHAGRYLAMLELALEATRDPQARQAFIRITDDAMNLTNDAHGADDEIAAKDVQVLAVFYNGVLFTSTVMPEILAGRTPGEVTRDALEKLL